MRLLVLLLASLAAAQDLRFLHGEFETRKFDEIYISGGSSWLGVAVFGGTDLYLLKDGAETPQRVHPPCQIDSIEALDGDGSVVYTGDRSGRVFRLTPENQCTKVFEVGSSVQAVKWDANRNRLWVGAGDGLYSWSPPAAAAVREEVGKFKIRALRLADGALWIGTEQGLWKLADGRLEQQDLSPPLNNNRINAVEFAAGQVWFGSHEHGLHRRPLAGGAPVGVEFGAKQVASLYRQGDFLLIGSESGLFRVNVSDTPWQPGVTLSQMEPRDPRPAERLQLQWQIGNFDQRTSRDLVRQHIEVLDSSGKVVMRQGVKPGDFQVTLQAPRERGDYKLRFILADLTGREVSVDPPDANFAVREAGLGVSAGTWAIAIGVLVLMAAGYIYMRSRRPLPAAPEPLPAPPVVPVPVPETRRQPEPVVPPSRRLKVFLCHSSGDKPEVRRIYSWLQEIGADPWLDEEKILPGQDWEREITVAVQESDAVLVCLSKGSVSKGGYVQKELRFVLDIAEQQPEGTIFLIPVKLEECQPPTRLHYLHWVNIFGDRGYDRLMAALQSRADALGIRLNPSGGQRASGIEAS